MRIILVKLTLYVMKKTREHKVQRFVPLQNYVKVQKYSKSLPDFVILELISLEWLVGLTAL